MLEIDISVSPCEVSSRHQFENDANGVEKYEGNSKVLSCINETYKLAFERLSPSN